MSKEEIIKNANEIIYNAESWIDDEEYTGKEEREWAEFEKKTIQGLLELYNKEKEKRMELEGKLAKRQWVKIKDNGEIEPLFYISKDKIREFIKEELPDDEIMECCECFDINGIFIRKKLEELLED